MQTWDVAEIFPRKGEWELHFSHSLRKCGLLSRLVTGVSIAVTCKMQVKRNTESECSGDIRQNHFVLTPCRRSSLSIVLIIGSSDRQRPFRSRVSLSFFKSSKTQVLRSASRPFAGLALEGWRMTGVVFISDFGRVSRSGGFETSDVTEAALLPIRINVRRMIQTLFERTYDRDVERTGIETELTRARD